MRVTEQEADDSGADVWYKVLNYLNSCPSRASLHGVMKAMKAEFSSRVVVVFRK